MNVYKRFCLVLMVFFVGQSAHCQKDFCASDQQHEVLLQRYLGHGAAITRLEQNYQRAVTSGQLTSHSRSPHTLPIVVHMIHDGGVENISDAQVIQGVEWINQGFSNTGYYDRGTGLNTDLQFCLARQDPNGDITTGITRTRSNLTDLAGNVDDVLLKNLIRWDPTSYINIWLVKSICRGTNCDVAGFATFPSAHGFPEDGIVMEAEWFGSDERNTSAMVHELGHYLGLLHTFSGGCGNQNCLQDGDRVCDTPPDQSTSVEYCNAQINSCTSDEDDISANNPFRPISQGGQGDQLDLIINYMDYSEWSCYSAFTMGQVERMDYFIHTSRASLINSEACNDPCPTPAFANIVELDLILNIGTNYTFHGTVQNLSTFNWTVNGMQASTTDELTYLFNSEGNYEIIFYANQNDPLCATSSDTVYVRVVCPVVASFVPLPTNCYSLDTTIEFNATSTQAIDHNWYLDGVFVQQGNTATIAFNSFGRHRIMLIASTALCQDTFYHIVQIGCHEICDNGYDDDGDLLVDQFDDDCCCQNQDYIFLCDTVCKPPADFPFNIRTKWSGNSTSNGYGSPLAGDVDGDGAIEVCMISTFNDIIFWDGVTGVEKWRFNFNQATAQAFALGDMDGDGDSEIITVQIDRTIACYHHDGQLMFTSDQPVGGRGNIQVLISLADFNYDGLPEIYVGNEVFNGQNGQFIQGDLTLSKGEAKDNTDILSGWQRRATAAVDILPDNFCANCTGLEIVAGNQIFSIDVLTGDFTVEVELSNERDGYTAVVDFDQDGDLDVVVNSIWRVGPGFEEVVYVWDGQTPTLINKILTVKGTGSNLGGTVVGNFDADLDVEIAFISYHKLYLLDHDFTIVWEYDLDEASAVGMLGFDFNLDGIQELVVRDKSNLHIVNARTGSAYFTQRLQSGTVMEMPAIADVDGDGNADILVDGSGRLNCLGISLPEEWADARNVFNQGQFFNVNINTDLSVPPQQQQHHLISDPQFNSFNCPIAIPRNYPDGTIEILNTTCQPNFVIVGVEICNENATVLSASTPVSIYCGDPQNTIANLLNTHVIGDDLSCQDCKSLIFTISDICSNTFYAVLNDDGSRQSPFSIATDFPITDIIECRYQNNIDSNILSQSQYTLDLGSDKTICQTDSVVLNGSNHFFSYQWNDQSSDSIFVAKLPGWYTLTVIDSCGKEFIDSVFISHLGIKPFNLGADTSLCDGVLTLSVINDFESYRWSTGERDTMISVWESGTYGLTVTDDCGVPLSDEIDVTFTPTISLNLDGALIPICAGDTANYQVSGYSMYRWYPSQGISCDTCADVSIFPDESTTYYLNVWDENECFEYDSLQIIVDTVLTLKENLFICPGDTIKFNEQIYTDTGIYMTERLNPMGCDSLFELNISFYPPIASVRDSLSFCQGESIILFDSLIIQSGTYQFRKTNPMNCDSLFEYYVQFSAAGGISRDSISVCLGDTIILNGEVISGAGTYTYRFSTAQGCDSLHVLQVIGGASTLWISNDTTIQAGSPVLVGVRLNGSVVEQVRWSPSDQLDCDDCAFTIANPLQTTWYQAEVVDAFGCLFIDSVLVALENNTTIYIPSAFSPNNDGVNEYFYPFGLANNQSRYSMSIYNRWGGKVFERQESEINLEKDGWDGTFKGELLNPDVFTYVISFIDNLETKTLSGEIHLIK